MNKKIAHWTKTELEGRDLMNIFLAPEELSSCDFLKKYEDHYK